jgi:hypothetical protein
VPQIHTVAGGGTCDLGAGPCDGIPATSSPIAYARGVAALPGGGFLYADEYDGLVRQVSSSGTVTTVASGLNVPIGVSVVPSGGFLIVVAGDATVRYVSPAGTMTTIAGTGTRGHMDDVGHTATGSQLDFGVADQTNEPWGDAQATSDGRVLIADSNNNRIRLVSGLNPGATIQTVAGGGACAGVCNGAAPLALQLGAPASVSPINGGAGGFLISDTNNHVIRRVSSLTGGTSTTVAGDGNGVFGGDGGQATSASIAYPAQVVAASDGSFLLVDRGNDRIRQVSATGVIDTVAGNGHPGYSGDGGPATAAQMGYPWNVSPTADGGFLVSDSSNNVIRAVSIPPVTSIALSPSGPDGRNGWYVSPVTPSISAVRAAATRCVVDPPAAPASYDALPAGCSLGAIAADGSHTIYAGSLDATGDREQPVSAAFKIDRTPPVLSCQGTPSFPVHARNEQVVASVADATSGPAAPLVSSVADTSGVGAHSVRLSASDNAGNVGSVSCSYRVLPASLKPIPFLYFIVDPHRRYSIATELVVTNVGRGAIVTVTCSGRGCPFSSRAVSGARCKGKRCRKERKSVAGGRTVDLLPLFAHRRLGVGTRLNVSVTAPNTIGRIWLTRIRASRQPSPTISCLFPGSSKPGVGC